MAKLIATAQQGTYAQLTLAIKLTTAKVAAIPTIPSAQAKGRVRVLRAAAPSFLRFWHTGQHKLQPC